jgi:alpha-1,6-mannosyltransferase
MLTWRIHWPPILLAFLGVLHAGLLWQLSAGGADEQLIAVLVTALLGGLTLAWISFDTRFDRMHIAWFWALALAVRALALCAEPLLEDDHHRYLWDGMRTATTFDPYLHAPAFFFGDATLPQTWQDTLSLVNNPDISTVYGPALQLLFAAAYSFKPGEILGLQLLWLWIDFLVLILLRSQKTPMRWLLVYALHPLVLRESLASAHPDGFIGLLVLLAMLSWNAKRSLLTGALIGLAVASKWSALIVLAAACFPPSGSRWHRWVTQVLLSSAVCVGVFYMPFLMAGHATEWRGLAEFSQHWLFNPLLFRLVEGVFGASMARPAAAIFLLALLIGMFRHWLAFESGKRPQWPPVDWAVALLLLLSPVVNPWYWLWALAPAVLMQRPMAVAMAAVAFISYINTTTFSQAGWQAASLSTYQVPAWAAGIQVLFFALTLGWQLQPPRSFFSLRI